MLGAWEIVARIIDREIMLPTFTSVFLSFGGLFAAGSFYLSLLFSLVRALIGYIVGYSLGIMCGIVAAKKPIFAAVLRPIVACMRAVPVAAITILLYIWLGPNILPSFIGGILVFPILYQQSKTATEGIGGELNDVLSEMGSGFWHSLRTVYLPMTLPTALSGISATFGMNVKAVITAEVLATSVPSIGYGIYYASQNVVEEISTLFAWVLVAVLLSVAFECVLRTVCKKAVERLTPSGVNG